MACYSKPDTVVDLFEQSYDPFWIAYSNVLLTYYIDSSFDSNADDFERLRANIHEQEEKPNALCKGL
jgi:hypothetical protein